MKRASTSSGTSRNAPVCRFCLDDDESVSRLINPCNCRGTVALVHPSCLEMWVEKSNNLVCQMCRIEYEQESAGLKKISEWTMPKPLPELPNKILFFTMHTWISYVLLLANILMLFGFSQLLEWIDSHYLVVYGLVIFGYSFVFGKIVNRVAKSWYEENMIYKFQDVSSKFERRELDDIQKLPWECAFCPDGTEIVSPLIWTCECRENFVHAKCIERFFGTSRIDLEECDNCGEPIRQEEVGLRKMGELTWPGPLSDSAEHKAEFYIMVAFIGHIIRLVRVAMIEDAVVHWKLLTTVAYLEYWGFFSLFTIAFVGMAVLVADRWYSENITYKFKDRNATRNQVKMSQLGDLVKRE